MFTGGVCCCVKSGKALQRKRTSFRDFFFHFCRAFKVSPTFAGGSGDWCGPLLGHLDHQDMPPAWGGA